MTDRQRALLEWLKQNGVIEVSNTWGRMARGICREPRPYDVKRGGVATVLEVTDRDGLQKLIDGAEKPKREKTYDLVLRALQKSPSTTTSELAHEVKRSKKTVRSVLNAMANQNKAEYADAHPRRWRLL